MRKSWIPGQEGGLLIGQLPQQTLANTSQPELFKTESKYTTWVSYHKIVTIVRQTITRTLKTYLLVDIYWSTECLLSMSPCMYVNLQVSKYMHSPVWVTQLVMHVICKQGLIGGFTTHRLIQTCGTICLWGLWTIRLWGFIPSSRVDRLAGAWLWLVATGTWDWPPETSHTRGKLLWTWMN